jgi:hypothetical protein
MKKNYILIFLVFMAMQFNAFAERINIPGLKLPGLIITEVRPNGEFQRYVGEPSCYVEITNVGDTAINLSAVNNYFVLVSGYFNSRINTVSDSLVDIRNTLTTKGNIPLQGILQPGESFVVSSVYDQKDSRGRDIPRHNTAIAKISKQVVHKEESGDIYFNVGENGWIDKPEWQCFGQDSVTPRWFSGEYPTLWAGAGAWYLLKWVFTTDSASVDSTFIDNFNLFLNSDGNPNGIKGDEMYPIAGVIDAMNTSVMVRKANVTKGNMNWHQSRGVDPTTSEWLVIPKNSSTDMAFTTAGVHGVFDLNYSEKYPDKIIIDDNTISVPWEMIRGDSLVRYFNLGEGMAWSYEMVGVFEDSASYIARPGDKFTLYSAGNRVNKKSYTIQVREPEPDAALVFPKRRLLLGEEIVLNPETGEPIDTIETRYWSDGFVYGLSKGPEIDSIINVAFATRTDSLFKYLDKPKKATWEFVFVDGVERVDLKFGDKLKVTSENGANVKEYFVAVSDYVPSENAYLSTVTWPDIDKNLYPRWNRGDTLIDFTPLKTEYTIELRFDATNFPAFQYIPQNLRSRIEVKDAVDLNGNLDQRTTSVTVYAESDTTFLTYNFHFVKQGVPVQPYIAEPFFSEFNKKGHTQGYAIEIYNPGTEDLDLSRYCVVRGAAGQTWQEAVETLVDGSTESSFYAGSNGMKIYQTHYFPSKRWKADSGIEAWTAIPNEENPYVGKGFLRDDNQTDPWVAGKDVFVMGTTQRHTSFQDKIASEADFLFKGADNIYAWDSTYIYVQANPCWTYNYLYLLRVDNDSILEGIKDVRDASAYTLIDRFDAIGDSLAGVKLTGTIALVRKPTVHQGTLERIGGAGETAESSEWIVIPNNFNNLGIHIMDPITNFKSTVTSIVLKVTPGYSGPNLSITGNISDYTPASIETVLDKADDSQTFAFMRGDTEVGADQNLADGDVLKVTSGDGKSITNYTLINATLDNNTSLTALEGSGLTISGDIISGATVGMTLKDVLANLQFGDKSVLNVVDASGALQPLTVHNVDSLMYDVMVSNNVFIEVVAENKDKMTYSFDLGLGNSDAILLSNILEIDQENKRIMELPLGSSAPGMLRMVFANEGATIRILDKGGLERTMGFLNIDDVVEVTAPDGVTKVVYGFDAGMFPVSVNPYEESPAEVVIYPNPVSNILNIKGFELASVQVYSISGTMMISETASYSNRVDVSRLPHGIYVIKMMDVNGRIAIDKFLKK